MEQTLMIGNWVQLAGLEPEEYKKGPFWEVEAINGSSASVKIDGVWYNRNEWQPIAIKGGWLVRLGFVEMKADPEVIMGAEAVKDLYREGVEKKGKHGKPYIYSISTFRHLIYCQSFNMVMGYGVDEMLVNPFPTIKYVHQVQNIIRLFAYAKKQAGFDPEEDGTDLTDRMYGEPKNKNTETEKTE